VCLTVETANNTMTGSLDYACFFIHQLLHHLEALVPYFSHFTKTYNLIIEFDAIVEIQINMYQHKVKGTPIDGFMKHMFKKSATSIVKIMTLYSVVHMVKRVQIAHFYLYWY